MTDTGAFLSSTLSTVVTVISIINLLFGFTVVFLERRSPSSTLAWLMVLFLLPLVGFVFYILSSQQITKARVNRLSEEEQTSLKEAVDLQQMDMITDTYPFCNEEERKWKDLITLNQRTCHSFLSQGNKVSLMADGKQIFRNLEETLRSARSTIDLEFFIMKPDETGKRILEILTEKAKEGIAVRLLLDGMGASKIKARHTKALTEAGGRVAYYFPSKFLKMNFRVNYRNHRKIVAVDNRVAFIGGNNLATEYTGVSKKFGGWRDSCLKLEGPCVMDALNRFIEDWRFAAHDDSPIAERKEDPEAAPPDTCGVQIIHSGPYVGTDENIKLAYLKMINGAKKSICIQTPYYIPDTSINEAIKSAALSGVDVKLMIPNRPDHIFVYWVTYSNAAALMKAGVKVYIYDKGFLHAKTLTVDDEVTSVGSANFDIRSFSLNFECNAVVYCSALAKRQREVFDEDIKNSYQLTDRIYKNRSLWIKFKESVGRLVSNIL